MAGQQREDCPGGERPIWAVPASVGGPVSGSARGVIREIDHELSRLERWEKAAASERAVLLAARAALAAIPRAPAERRRVSQNEVSAYLTEHPGSWPEEIVGSLGVPAVVVSNHLHRGRDTRYEQREDGWYLPAGGESRAR